MGMSGSALFHKFKKRLVGLPARGFIAHHLLRAGKLEAGQRAGDKSHGKTGIVDQLSELGRRPSGYRRLQIRQAADVGGVDVDPTIP